MKGIKTTIYKSPGCRTGRYTPYAPLVLESVVHLPDAPLTKVEAIGWLTTNGAAYCQQDS